MTIAVFGATGGTGRAFVDQARAQGHRLRALVRDPSRANLPADVEIVTGNATDPAVVERLVTGTEHVVSMLGLPSSRRDDTTVSDSTRTVVTVMERLGVRRFVCVSVFGLGESWDQASWLFRRFVYPAFLAATYADRRRQEDEVVRSELDWTLVRPTRLVDGPPTGLVQVLSSGTTRLHDTVSRADVAAYLLRVLDDPTTYRRSLTLSAA